MLRKQLGLNHGYNVSGVWWLCWEVKEWADKHNRSGEFIAGGYRRGLGKIDETID